MLASLSGNAQTLSQREAIARIVANNAGVKGIQASGNADVLSLQHGSR